MSIDLNLINVLNIFLLLGVLQGGIVSVLLFLKKADSFANKLLAFWIFLLALSNFQIIINTSNLYLLFGQRITLLAPLSLNLFFGPLIWLFCRKVTDSSFNFKPKTYWHLVPGFLELIYYTLIYVQPLSFRQQFYGAVHWRYIEPSLEVMATVSFIYYLWISIQGIRNYGQRLKAVYSDPNMDTYDWLRKFLNVLMVFSLIWLILTIVDVFLMGYQLGYIYFYPYYLLIAFLSYFVGFTGYYRTKAIVLSLPKTISKTKPLLKQEQLSSYEVQLHNLMSEKRMYLNSSLRALDVATALGTNVQTLSYVLNQGLKVSFHDFINKLRVEHVKSRLNSNDITRMSLLGIAQESGFNSEASFYRIFKKFTGMTPKAYIRNYSQNII